MFCDKAHTLIKELDRNRDILSPYNVRKLKYILMLHKMNQNFSE